MTNTNKQQKEKKKIKEKRYASKSTKHEDFGCQPSNFEFSAP